MVWAGFILRTKERYPWGIRWTSILQEKLGSSRVRVIEEGLCGRTTVFEDCYRKGRKGIESLPFILESQQPVDAAVLMLGTNDCKACYHNSPYIIARGLSLCVDELLRCIEPGRILIVSPLHLGKDVWKEPFDPEFDQRSVEVSQGLKKEYQKIAEQKQVHFLAASDFVNPSDDDREHLDKAGHAVLAEQILHALHQNHALE